MSIGAVVGLDTQQLLRAVCGVAFGRARMSAVYRFLRGVDPVTGDADPDRRLTRLNELDDAANDCVEPRRGVTTCTGQACGFRYGGPDCVQERHR